MAEDFDERRDCARCKQGLIVRPMVLLSQTPQLECRILLGLLAAIGDLLDNEFYEGWEATLDARDILSCEASILAPHAAGHAGESQSGRAPAHGGKLGGPDTRSLRCFGSFEKSCRKKQWSPNWASSLEKKATHASPHFSNRHTSIAKNWWDGTAERNNPK